MSIFELIGLQIQIGKAAAQPGKPKAPIERLVRQFTAWLCPGFSVAVKTMQSGNAKTELEKLGVPSGRITTRAYGADNPVANNDTATGRQLNRRVEIVFPQ